METLQELVNYLGGIVWGPYVLLPLLVGTGAYLMLGLRFMPARHLFPAFKQMLAGRKNQGTEGELSPFNAMMASMAATVGTGNIVGVATAIMIGGPGAVFWMWVTAFLGMATKYCECTLAVKYREVTPDGKYVGGPMYYIKNGLGKNWKWMGVLFAIFGAVASFGIGNMSQANAITGNLNQLLGIPQWAVAVALVVLVGIVLIGGVQRVGAVAGKVVPVMAIFYIGMGIVIMLMNIDKVWPAFSSIFIYAFQPAPAVGGFVGSTMMIAMRFGMARGLFSNEAGLGSAPITHATAIVDHPVKQGFLGMIDPFLDTIVICTMTAIVILIAGDWSATDRGSAAVMTSVAFNHVLPGVGGYGVALGLVLFAYTTILGWSIYGERCCIFLFGHKASLPFRVVFTLVVPLGCLAQLDFVWSLSDLFNGLMAIPNLIAVLLLSPVVFKLTKEYFEKELGKKI
ncbi:MAG: sodium:alanine symporter family protein [Deltaproteobacteria bacterium]|jgi:AGCS family alanine or glycine:cation symporter|nr:sodium:alanine symporter family protein [Deltaproteobacteria bacterium]